MMFQPLERLRVNEAAETEKAKQEQKIISKILSCQKPFFKNEFFIILFYIFY